jgi:hypothetical protein
MRSHTVRLYLATGTVLVFFALWATIAAKPWASAARPHADPRLVALTPWQRQLARESVAVKHLVHRRWTLYEKRLKARQAEIRAAEQAHAAQVAAARAAAARIAAAQAAAAPTGSSSSPTRTVTTYAAAPAAAAPATQSAAPPSPKVVTLPPQVQIVSLPPATSPATSSSSSRP